MQRKKKKKALRSKAEYEQFLQQCGRWPEPMSVLIMDNVSFHHTERVKDLCSTARVKLAYLPLYSPGLNVTTWFLSFLT